MTESRAKENGTLFVLPRRSKKLHSRLSEEVLYFQEENNEDRTHRPTFSPVYGCYTMIVTNMQYFSSMPSVPFFWIIQDLTKAEEALRGNKALALGRCTKKQDATLCKDNPD